MSLYLIRHGETAENRSKVVQLPHVPLSDTGQAQAARLAQRMSSVGIKHIISSDLLRAKQTAEAIQRATGATIQFTPLLHERSFGDLRGRTYEQIGEDFFAEGFEPPNGESWAQFNARVEQAWFFILGQLGELPNEVAIVTHGLVCRAIVERHLDSAAQALMDGPWQNTSVTKISRTAPHCAVYVNDVIHLTEEPGSSQGGAV